MITLHHFGPAFGLPDPSPFCIKAEILLKLSGLPHALRIGDLRRAPKGKLPLIVEDGVTISDFARGPAQFFKPVPAPLRPLVCALVRRKVRRNVDGHGIGRHSPSERLQLSARALDAMVAILGERPFFGGDAPVGGDAAPGAFLIAALSPLFDSPFRGLIEQRPTLMAYAGRMRARFFAEAEPLRPGA